MIIYTSKIERLEYVLQSTTIGNRIHCSEHSLFSIISTSAAITLSETKQKSIKTFKKWSNKKRVEMVFGKARRVELKYGIQLESIGIDRFSIGIG